MKGYKAFVLHQPKLPLSSAGGTGNVALISHSASVASDPRWEWLDISLYLKGQRERSGRKWGTGHRMRKGEGSLGCCVHPCRVRAYGHLRVCHGAW
eukprot:424414-Pyramimonas_sp.AAC.1